MTQISEVLQVSGVPDATIALAERHNLHILTLLNLTRSLAIAKLDPLRGRFMIHPLREDNPFIVNRQPFAVPDPCDPSVDILYAIQDAVEDARLCHEIMQGNPPTEEIITVYLTLYRWNRFLAARHPDVEVRRTLFLKAAAAEAEIEDLRAVAATGTNAHAKLVLERLNV